MLRLFCAVSSRQIVLQMMVIREVRGWCFGESWFYFWPETDCSNVTWSISFGQGFAFIPKQLIRFGGEFILLFIRLAKQSSPTRLITFCPLVGHVSVTEVPVHPPIKQTMRDKYERFIDSDLNHRILLFSRISNSALQRHKGIKSIDCQWHWEQIDLHFFFFFFFLMTPVAQANHPFTSLCTVEIFLFVRKQFTQGEWPLPDTGSRRVVLCAQSDCPQKKAQKKHNCDSLFVYPF